MVTSAALDICAICVVGYLVAFTDSRRRCAPRRRTEYNTSLLCSPAELGTINACIPGEVLAVCGSGGVFTAGCRYEMVDVTGMTTAGVTLRS